MTTLFYIVVALAFAAVAYARQNDLLPGSIHVGAPLAYGFFTAYAAWFLGYQIPYIAALGAVTFAGLLIWTLGARKNTRNIVLTMTLRGFYLMPLFFMLSALWSGVVVGFIGQGIIYRLPVKFAEPIFAAIIGLAIGQKLLAGF